MEKGTKYTNRLQGKRVLVLGGTSGIGFSVAEACIENGAIVTVASSQQTKVDSAIQRILQSYPDAKDRIAGKSCDLSNPNTIETELANLFDFATDNKQTKLDHIAFTAGNNWNIPSFAEVTVSDIQRCFQVRLAGGILVGKYAGLYMNASPASSLTFTSGAGVWRPPPEFIVQSTQGAAMEGLVRGLAVQLAPIRTNLMVPGFVDTDFWGERTEAQKSRMEMLSKRVLLESFGAPEDIAEGYLLSMKSAYMTGAVVPIEGGFMLK